MPYTRINGSTFPAPDPAVVAATPPLNDPNYFADIPGQSIDDLEYLQQLFAINSGEVKRFYDALSAHPSGFSNPPDCTPATPQCSLSGGFSIVRADWSGRPACFALSQMAKR
jgi:hypothetical protein